MVVWGWFGKLFAVSPTLRDLDKRLSLVEDDMGDMVERFRRFQNRENMRTARSVKGGLSYELQDRVASELAAAPQTPESPEEARATLKARLSAQLRRH